MQNNILTSKIMGKVSISLCLLTISACTQMMRHSNTLVFGTDTSFGIKVGQDVNQIPSIEVGWSRQEAAFVPLLANTSAANNETGNLVPCEPTPNNDCHFRATHNGNDKDSYSTIASFGSKIGTDTSTNGTSGDVAIAQYFATGIAAQHLVLTGGANIIQAGGDTAAKAKSAAVAAEAISKAEQARMRAAADYDRGRAAALAILGGDNDATLDISNDEFTQLHNEMGSNCTSSEVRSELSPSDRQQIDENTLTVGAYLDAIRTNIPSCLDKLISD